MTHQTVNLGKYWKLLPATLIRALLLAVARQFKLSTT